jgi:cytoskeleton protein RodZ
METGLDWVDCAANSWQRGSRTSADRLLRRAFYFMALNRKWMRWMTIDNTQEDRPDEHPDEPDAMTENLPDQETTPPADHLPTVGDELRMRRESSGATIRDVAEAVRIQRRYLEALETGHLEDLPGTVYALGFLRTYAEYYGFNGDEFVSRFKEETEGKRRQQDYVLPEPIEEARVPTAAIVVVAIVLAVAAYVTWYSLRPDGGETVSAVPEVPAHLATLVEDAPAASAPGEPAQGEAAPAGSGAETPAVETESVEVSAPPQEPAVAAEAETPIAPGPVETAAVPVAPVEPDEPVAPAEADTSTAPVESVTEEAVHVPQVFGPGGADARIVITAADDAWIEISDAEGNLLLSRTMRAGDSYRVPNRDGLVFVTGNAGGLQILVDGTLVPAIGGTGIVRKNVKLDPELLKAGRAWR